MAGFVGLILSFLICANVFAGGSIGAGADIRHQFGQPVITGEYDRIVGIYWGTNYGLGHTGLAYGRTWQVGMGAIAVAKLDQDVGTHLNFLPWAKYCATACCFAFTHISHGAFLGIAPDKANSGMNFITIEFPLRR